MKNIPKKLKYKIYKLIKSIPLVQKYRERIWARKIKQNTPVFVYQMGKVASSSIYSSLNEQYDGFILHSHRISQPRNSFPILIVYETHLKTKFLYKMHKQQGTPIKIISLIREPIARNISSFFQHFIRVTGYSYEKSPHSLDELYAIFLEYYEHHLPLVWFDLHIKKYFAIDVYEKPFPKKGYDFFKKDNVEVLLLKHDLDDDTKESIIAEYLGMEQFRMRNKNIGSKKIYRTTYQAFKQLPLPDEYIDSMLNSKYARHFYGDEIAGIRKKWQK